MVDVLLKSLLKKIAVLCSDIQLLNFEHQWFEVTAERFFLYRQLLKSALKFIFVSEKSIWLKQRSEN